MQNIRVRFNSKPTFLKNSQNLERHETPVPQFKVPSWWKITFMSLEELLEFRSRKDAFLASSQSPLPTEVRTGFEALSYFAYDSKLVFEVPLRVSQNFEHVMMETSSGVRKSYVRAGSISFEVGGETCQLTAFSNPESEDPELFIPFRDASSGTQTYGGGRYLDPKLSADGSVVLDFNLAYNPYCAYSEGWACPIPPLENWLRIPILAGEKTFGATK
jgi:uncharacterized protein